MAVETKVTYCRICEPLCGLVATVTDGTVTQLRPDPDHPLSRGQACPKGIAFVDIQNDPEFGDVNNFSTEFFADNFGMFDGNDVYAILAAVPAPISRSVGPATSRPRTRTAAPSSRSSWSR